MKTVTLCIPKNKRNEKKEKQQKKMKRKFNARSYYVLESNNKQLLYYCELYSIFKYALQDEENKQQQRTRRTTN